jgi:hypothetical protein
LVGPGGVIVLAIPAGGELIQVRIRRLKLVQMIGLMVGGAASLAILLAAPARSAPMTGMGSMATMHMTSSPTSGMSLRQRFNYLSRQHSNNCGLQPSSFASMPGTMRLQGACCGPMDAKLYPEYVKQIRELAKYDPRYVPSDPYNMSVALARRLVGFNDTILLNHAQQQVYNRAFPLAQDHAPCCCHCWRWTAFEGQAKYFIVYRRFTSKQIATLWGLDDGCGDTSGGMTMTG